VAEECALEFAATFYTLFFELWNATHFPVPGLSGIQAQRQFSAPHRPSWSRRRNPHRNGG
jgi:hypothetical protein